MYTIEIKRGMHSIVVVLLEYKLAIKIYKKELIKNARKEYLFLRELSIRGVNVPKSYALIVRENIPPMLIREYIEGRHFIDILRKADSRETLGLFKKLIMLAYELDKYGIFLDELSFPTKNIIVTPGNELYIVDFERAVRNRKRSNVTQILGYLISSMKSNGLVGKKISKFIDVDKLLEAAKNYSKSKEIEQVIKLFDIGG